MSADLRPLPARDVHHLDDRALGRLRWRCRRGMLENDLILTRFLDVRGAAITADEVAGLDRLLDLSDNELWDLLSGRAESADDSVGPVLRALRERTTVNPTSSDPD